MVSYKPSFNKFYQVYEGSFKWLKLRNQKCSLAFQASILVKLRINCRSWRKMARGVLLITACILDPFLTGEKGMAQWWEHSPPMQCGPDSNRGVDAQGWVCCWFSRLLREVFLRGLRFSPLLKNQHFQIPILYSTHGHVFSYRTPKCFVGK